MVDPLGHKPVLLTPHFGTHTTVGIGVVIVRVCGELDICTAPLLATELRELQRPGNHVVVDLESVDFMDCAGLHVLLSAAESASSVGSSVSVTAAPPQVERLFELSRAAQSLRIVSGSAVAA